MDDLQKIYFRIAQNIRQYRVKNRLNQAILAEHTGLTQSMISRIENEKCHLDIQTAFKIANALGISLETLMFEEDMKEQGTSSIEGKESRIAIERKANRAKEFFPMSKCENTRFYVYYIDEFIEQGTSICKIKKSEIKFEYARHAYLANAILLEEDGPKKRRVTGSVEMDQSYAYGRFFDPERDYSYEIIFYYWRTAREKIYYGGGGLLQCNSKLPTARFCIISRNEIHQKKYGELIELLKIGITDKKEKLNKMDLSNRAVLRLTKDKNAIIFDWLVQNAGLTKNKR